MQQLNTLVAGLVSGFLSVALLLSILMGIVKFFTTLPLISQ
jgi:hypothetical protein